MDNIPTAEEFLKDRADYNPVTGFYGLVEEGDLIMFAKLHAKAALDAASKISAVETMGNENDAYSLKNSIINAYPESNIK